MLHKSTILQSRLQNDNLVYSSGGPKGQVIELAFKIASSDSKKLEEVALVLFKVCKMNPRN